MKIHPEDVVEIHMAHARKEPVKSIAKRFGVHRSTIWLYTLGEERRAEIMQEKQRKNPTSCDCGTSYVSHERCKRCKKLIHPKEGCQCWISPLVKQYDYDALYAFAIKIMLNELA